MRVGLPNTIPLLKRERFRHISYFCRPTIVAAYIIDAQVDASGDSISGAPIPGTEHCLRVSCNQINFINILTLTRFCRIIG